METSTKADIQMEELMTSLTYLRLDHSYRGNTQEFVVGWLDKIREYENLTPVNPTSHQQ